MRKKFTLLISCIAVCMLCSITAWGQGHDYGPFFPQDADGYGAGAAKVTYSARGANYQWYNGDGKMILLDGSDYDDYSRSCCSGMPTVIQNWVNNYPGTVTVNVPINGSVWSDPNYYDIFEYRKLYVWGHDRTTSATNCGCTPSCPCTGTSAKRGERALNGDIVVAAGADVRLVRNILKSGGGALPNLIGSATLTLPVGDEYSIRFDAPYTGTGGGYGGVNITGGWTTFDKGQGIGFKHGITSNQDFNVHGGGVTNRLPRTDGEYGGTRLMLHASTIGQQRITVDTKAAGAAVYVFNYETGHQVTIGHGGNAGFKQYTVNGGDLFVRNDNACQNLVFAADFAPVISGNGNIYINENNNDPAAGTTYPTVTGTSPQALSNSANRGNTTFDENATFTFAANTGQLSIEGGAVTFDKTYTYTSTANNPHIIAAKGASTMCNTQSGHIIFNGAVNVTKALNQTLWFAKNDIQTTVNAPVTYNLSSSTQTDWRAGRNIDMRSSVDFISATGASGDINWYAMNDIMTNWSFNPAAGNGYVKYDIQGNSSADVLWRAVNNIHTKGRVDFAFAPATTGTLKLVSDTGNIKAERVWAINVNNVANDILISAESNPEGLTNRGVGRIETYDSVRITRTNTGAGKTEILSQNDIWTAMVDIENTVPSANTYLIESHSGDIWFGHNDSLSNPSRLNNNPAANPIAYDLNKFTFTAPGASNGWLHVYSGFGDLDQGKIPWGGGNIHFTHINETLGNTSNHPTEFKIPFSNWYYCGNQYHDDVTDYERAGIIGGVARCAIINKQPNPAVNTLCTDTGLIYKGYDGELLFDAGTRGNIIINNGSYLTFQGGTGNAKFLTRWGDIDMRYPFDVDSMQGSLLFLANSELANKLNTGNCTCEEKRNNVYLQDFQYNPIKNSGSIFIGADNNIKLQYGGLKGSAWNTNQRDPFYSGNAGYPCGDSYHCDSDTSENKARDLILNFDTINSGGFAAVASDLIDVYKNIIYTGGNGSGMSSVPGYGSLHGEAVAGYGLYIKTQGNKKNWDHNAFGVEVNACWPPKCDDPCNYSILQNVARVTFHSDARFYAENQRVYVGSPVMNTYGNLELNTHLNKGSKTGITIQTDSLIMHDSMILDGKLTHFTTWSGLYRDMPIVKFGHQRFTPPFVEDGSVCAPCFTHDKGKGDLDSIFVTFRNGASMSRLHTLVADHTVLSFLTDSFDHVKGDPVINAKFYTDTFKVRNHVELFTNPKHTNDGHFELISEEQMESKDYAGIYARHLHMEPIGPTCDDFAYSQLWMPDSALDVITTSTFGGYGWIHADVHVEIDATLAPGYASLRSSGDYCYELSGGTLKMKNLRLDKGADLRFSIGHHPGELGEIADCIIVDDLTMYGSVDVIIEERCKQQFIEGCYPLIYYNTIAIDTVNLNNLKLVTKKLNGYDLTLDTSEPGVVYLCVGAGTLPTITREVLIPETAGVTTDPEPGAHYVRSQSNFEFKAKYSTEKPLKVTTGRTILGVEEELTGKLNSNGEYEYVIRQVTQNIVLKFGPDFATSNDMIEGKAVWSHDNTIYIRVEKEDIASIYSVTGQLVKRIEFDGTTSVQLERGVYIVTLKDGSVHKVILK